MSNTQLQQLIETNARQLAALDQTQAKLDSCKIHTANDAEAWEIQAALDRHRFDIELEQLVLRNAKLS